MICFLNTKLYGCKKHSTLCVGGVKYWSGWENSSDKAREMNTNKKLFRYLIARTSGALVSWKHRRYSIAMGTNQNAPSGESTSKHVSRIRVTGALKAHQISDSNIVMVSYSWLDNVEKITAFCHVLVYHAKKLTFFKNLLSSIVMCNM